MLECNIHLREIYLPNRYMYSYIPSYPLPPIKYRSNVIVAMSFKKQQFYVLALILFLIPLFYINRYNIVPNT